MNFQFQTAIIRYGYLLFTLSALFVLLTACSSNNSTAIATPDPATDEVTISPTLSGTLRVPPIAGAGSGVSSFTVDKLSGAISGSVTSSNLSAPITVAHIHTGEAGIEGGVAIALEASNDANIFNVPAGSVLDNEQLANFLAGKLYVNVHTSTNPSGEIRGQLLPAGITVVRSVLDGLQETAPVTTTSGAIGYVTVDTTSGAILGNLRTDLDDATAAHIHGGFAGANGGVLIGFDQDASDASLWQLPDSASFTEEQLAQFKAGGTYFNIHTPANPPGELRGQIAPQGISVVRTELDGLQETTPVTTTAAAVAFLTVNTTSGAAIANMSTTDLETATAAHIHDGFAGTDGGVIIGFVQDAADVSVWTFPDDASFTQEQLTQLNAGGTYLNIHTPANPPGEVRGQVVPDGITVVSDALEGSQEVPAVDTVGSGTGYTTVNNESGAVIAVIRTAGLMDTATAAHIHAAAAGSNGGAIIVMEQDATDSSLWTSPADATLDSGQLGAFSNAGLYFNVHTPANPGGDIRGQITP